jgi:hemoglobin
MSDQAIPSPAMPLQVVAGSGTTLFEAVGGQDTFVRLVDRFYAGVAGDPVLAAMYSAQDRAEGYAGARNRMTAFLAQYFGGPRAYSDERGHPRLRLRHAPFDIDTDARDRWLHHAETAVRDLGLRPDHEAALWNYLERAAHSLTNR